ncbi:MAG TPA: acylphosphatase [Gammaproteobacteria bacterium]|nr:acylphosphatase [Gammaproteobacteria bacterium]
MKTGMHCVIYGRVQGVGFRQSTQKKAQALGVGGWVRNCENGSVELVAAGEQVAVQALVDWLEQGPLLAEVTQLEINPLTHFESFETFKVMAD